MVRYVVMLHVELATSPGSDSLVARDIAAIVQQFGGSRLISRQANSGLGLFKGLRAAERVGTGSIGGFATFAAITADRRLIRSQTQRGGSSRSRLDQAPRW